MTQRTGIRKFLESSFWLEPRAYSKAEAWLDLIQTVAAYRPRQYTASGLTVTLRRGEFMASVRFLAKRWGWSHPTVVRFLKHCVEAGHLVYRDVNHDMNQPSAVYLVVEYEEYRGTHASPEPRDEPRSEPKKLQVTRKLVPTGTNLKTITERSPKQQVLARFAEPWSESRGTPSFPRIGRMLKGLLPKHGERQVLLVWQGYLEDRQAFTASPEDFMNNYEVWRRKWGVEIGEDGSERMVPDAPAAA